MKVYHEVKFGGQDGYKMKVEITGLSDEIKSHQIPDLTTGKVKKFFASMAQTFDPSRAAGVSDIPAGDARFLMAQQNTVFSRCIEDIRGGHESATLAKAIKGQSGAERAKLLDSGNQKPQSADRESALREIRGIINNYRPKNRQFQPGGD